MSILLCCLSFPRESFFCFHCHFFSVKFPLSRVLLNPIRQPSTNRKGRLDRTQVPHTQPLRESTHNSLLPPWPFLCGGEGDQTDIPAVFLVARRFTQESNVPPKPPAPLLFRPPRRLRGLRGGPPEPAGELRRLHHPGRVWFVPLGANVCHTGALGCAPPEFRNGRVRALSRSWGCFVSRVSLCGLVFFVSFFVFVCFVALSGRRF